MKATLLLIMALALVGCPSIPNKKLLIADPIVEKVIREQLKKPTGELTKADLEEVTKFVLRNNQLSDVSALAGL